MILILRLYSFSKIEFNINIKTNGTIIKKIVLPVRLQSVSLNNKGIKLYAVIIINLDVVDRILLKNFEFRRTKKVIVEKQPTNVETRKTTS